MAKQFNALTGTPVSLTHQEVFKGAKVVTGVLARRTRRRAARACLLYTSPSPRDQRGSRMPSSA